MSFLSNPIILCASVAFGIILILVTVVVICCKRSADIEREELKELSQEIEADLTEEIVADPDQEKIENVLSKMQEALEVKKEEPISFEQEQEENAVISYQELLNSLGAKSSIDIDSIEVFDDELDNHVEISDFNKEIIDAYQSEELSKEMFRFQNDYSNEELSQEIVSETPVMNFDFSAENIDFMEDEPIDVVEPTHEVYEAKHVVSNMPKKFRRTELISPVYGIIKEEHNFIKDDVEKLDLDDDSLLDEIQYEFFFFCDKICCGDFMKFYIYSLGCKVNSYESNVMKDNLINNGFVFSDIDDADIVIINSCSVTNSADNKTMKLIRHVRSNFDVILVVVGCFIQSHKDSLDGIDADILIGNKNKSVISNYINRFLVDRKRIIDLYDVSNIDFEVMKLNNYDHTRAFVKIQDGCNNFCSYCIIPFTRGGVRSKDKDLVINEVKTLISNGHKEIVLTGIHTGNYGNEDYDFACLLSDLVKIDGLERLRISSIEITEINDRVIDIIKNNDVLVDHMHIPLQSGSDTILKLMNRKYDMNYFFDKINVLRSIRPDISITTDVIVGFPGETDELFLETVDSIKKIGFSKLHVFPYSRRSGTVADTMDNQIDDCIKKKRVKVLLDLSRELEILYMNKFKGKKVSFIPEVLKDGYMIGHTGNYLLIKCKDSNFNHELHDVLITDISYPYCISKVD